MACLPPDLAADAELFNDFDDILKQSEFSSWDGENQVILGIDGGGDCHNWVSGASYSSISIDPASPGFMEAMMLVNELWSTNSSIGVTETSYNYSEACSSPYYPACSSRNPISEMGMTHAPSMETEIISGAGRHPLSPFSSNASNINHTDGWVSVCSSPLMAPSAPIDSCPDAEQITPNSSPSLPAHMVGGQEMPNCDANHRLHSPSFITLPYSSQNEDFVRIPTIDNGQLASYEGYCRPNFEAYAANDRAVWPNRANCAANDGCMLRASDGRNEASTEDDCEGVAIEVKSHTLQLDDGYIWRKYGEKPIKGKIHRRSYFRCANSKCIVKKRSENSSRLQGYVLMTYYGKHNHHPTN